MLALPETRTHHQLARWVNAQRLTFKSRVVQATVRSSWTDTDRKIGRLRWPGKGRKGLRLELQTGRHGTIYAHDTSQCYRTHEEARVWIAKNLSGRSRPLKE